MLSIPQIPLTLLDALHNQTPMLRLRQISLIGLFRYNPDTPTEFAADNQRRVDALRALHPQLREVLVNSERYVVWETVSNSVA